jgi:tetratricopeptide (TPR) repeat protein
LIDSQIAILVKENEMRQALEKMRLRIELISRWRSDEYHEMAKELMRMACYFSLKGEDSEAKELLEQSHRVTKSIRGGDIRREIDLIKVLAVTYDALGKIDEAIKHYNIAMDLRKKSNRVDIDDQSKFLQESCVLLVRSPIICFFYLLSEELNHFTSVHRMLSRIATYCPANMMRPLATLKSRCNFKRIYQVMI